jgi:ABC-type branched-subunit amino acid transport system ATPase component
MRKNVQRASIRQSCQREHLFPPLREFRSRLAGNLSGGQQHMLTIARSLLTKPQLLLLDESHEGLAPLITQDVVGAIQPSINLPGSKTATRIALFEGSEQITISALSARSLGEVPASA